MKRQAICTIIAKNYVALARILAQSVQAHNPSVPLYALTVDDVTGFLDAYREPFQWVTLEELNIPDTSSFCFKYDIFELATAAKPYLLDYLFEEKSVDIALYFDLDILDTHPLDVLFDLLEEADILLAPHLDTDYPGSTICRAGAMAGVWRSIRVGRTASNDGRARRRANLEPLGDVPPPIPGTPGSAASTATVKAARTAAGL